MEWSFVSSFGVKSVTWRREIITQERFTSSWNYLIFDIKIIRRRVYYRGRYIRQHELCGALSVSRRHCRECLGKNKRKKLFLVFKFKNITNK